MSETHVMRRFYFPPEIWKLIYEFDPTFLRDAYASVLDALPSRFSSWKACLIQHSSFGRLERWERLVLRWPYRGSTRIPWVQDRVQWTCENFRDLEGVPKGHVLFMLNESLTVAERVRLVETGSPHGE